MLRSLLNILSAFGFPLTVFAVPIYVLTSGIAAINGFAREDLELDLAATRRALNTERREFNQHFAEDMTEQIVHSACVDTCMTLDYDTDNRDGPQFVYTCVGHGARGFTCEWTNLDDNRRPKPKHPRPRPAIR